MPKFDTDFLFNQINWNLLILKGFLNYWRIDKNYSGINYGRKW